MSDASGVVTVWIDDPPLNVLGRAVVERLDAELRDLPAATRVVVLRGREERAFSAGADLTTFTAAGGPPVELQPLADLIESLDAPVIAAIGGHCLGGGLELALACDVRVAHLEASLGFPEVGLGLIPGGGGSQRAPRLIGGGRAAWLILSGERLTAARAAAWGLVEFVAADLDATVERLTDTLARQPASALAQAKRLLLATRERRSDERELEVFAACLASAEGREGVAAFLERRPPRWSNP